MKNRICVWVLIIALFVSALSVPAFAVQESAEQIVNAEKNTIEIKGKAPSGNQNVLVQILKPGIDEAVALEDIVFQKQITTDETGDFSVIFAALSNWESGVYPVKFYYEDGKTEALTLEYKSTKDIGSDFKLLSDAHDVVSVRRILEQYGEEWDFDFGLYSVLDDGAKNKVVECFIESEGKNAINVAEASKIFDSAVIAVATTAYKGEFSDLVVGAYGEYTGFSETSAYKKFSGVADVCRVGNALVTHSFKNSEEAKKYFEIEICLSVIANAKGWYDVNEAIEILGTVLSLDLGTYAEAPEAIGMELSGKNFTLEKFLAELQKQIQKNTGKKVIFVDVEEQTDWASKSVNSLYEAGIVNGVSESLFNPNGSVTREQFAKMIVAMLGETEMNSENSFSDVDNKEWYAPYVAMAKESGIVNGVSETKFGVGQYITREQMATMIYRAGQLIGYTANGIPKVFTDENQISDYAKEAIDALTAGGVINGMSDGSFAPHATATRAEAACMIDNMMCVTGYSANVKSGYMPVSGTDPFVKYKQDFNGLTEKTYKETDKYTFLGWYFVPGSTTYLAALPAPGGKSKYKMPSEQKDMAIAILAEKSEKAGHFDTKPFPLSDDTSGKMRMEMNLYVENDNLSPNYKVFDSEFYSWVHMRGSHIMPLFYLAGDGGLYYYDESGLGVRCGDYEQKQWIHIAIDFDAEKKAYTLYLNDVAIAKNVPYNNKDIKWDGTDSEPGLRKVRVRMSVTPDSAGNSVTYIDDFILAKYTDAPLAIPVKPQTGDNSVRILVSDNVNLTSLNQIEVYVNGVKLTNTGNIENGHYVVSLMNALKHGDAVTVTIGKWLENKNGLLTGTPQTFSYTVQ